MSIFKFNSKPELEHPKTNNRLSVKFLEELVLSNEKIRVKLLDEYGFIYSGIYDPDPRHAISGPYYTRLYNKEKNDLLLFPEIIILSHETEIIYIQYIGVIDYDSIPNVNNLFFQELIKEFDNAGYRYYPEHGIYESKLKMLNSDKTESLNLSEIKTQAKTKAILNMCVLKHLVAKKKS